MFTKNAAKTLSLALVLGWFAPIAEATDAKVLQGSVCSESPKDLGHWSHALVPTNTSASNITIICPLERDNTQNTNGLVDLDVRVSTGTVALRCTAYSLKSSGVSLVSVEKVTTAMGASTLDWGNTLNLGEAETGTYVLTCLVPPGASVSSIRYHEY